MTDWYSINLGDGITATEPLADIGARFDEAATAAGHPPQMAVFMRYESHNQLHCEVRAYFPPACAEFAQALGATPCAKPLPSSLTLLAGDAAAWPLLFPEGRGISDGKTENME